LFDWWTATFVAALIGQHIRVLRPGAASHVFSVFSAPCMLGLSAWCHDIVAPSHRPPLQSKTDFCRGLFQDMGQDNDG
jgi:hypothetical protein